MWLPGSFILTLFSLFFLFTWYKKELNVTGVECHTIGKHFFQERTKNFHLIECHTSMCSYSLRILLYMPYKKAFLLIRSVAHLEIHLHTFKVELKDHKNLVNISFLLVDSMYFPWSTKIRRDSAFSLASSDATLAESELHSLWVLNLEELVTYTAWATRLHFLSCAYMTAC